ncbi:MAG: hypothetical protein WCP95_07000 [Actinomycetes bacterium]
MAHDDGLQDIDVLDTAVFAVADDATLLVAVREVVLSSFGIELTEAPGEAWGAETDVGTLFVGTMSDFIVGLELRLPGEYEATSPLLEYLNDRNAATTFVTFSILDDRLWVSGNVDGSPFAPSHLTRVLDFMFQAAVAVSADVQADVD